MENGKNIQKIEFYVYPKIIFCFIFVVEPPYRRYIFIMCVVRLVLKHKLKSGSNSKCRHVYIKLQYCIKITTENPRNLPWQFLEVDFLVLFMWS